MSSHRAKRVETALLADTGAVEYNNKMRVLSENREYKRNRSVGAAKNRLHSHINVGIGEKKKKNKIKFSSSVIGVKTTNKILNNGEGMKIVRISYYITLRRSDAYRRRKRRHSFCCCSGD